ncbi:MAG: hypothetical protein RLY57_439 [Candidatus Parcubacteria bacterium]|jgi:hypothetical protein
MKEGYIEFQSMPQFTEVETIIPEIKPPLPTEPFEGQFRPVRPADAAAEISRLLGKNERVKDFFREFAGQIVIEIGPGELLSGYEIASLSNARAYIGVEPFGFFRNLKKFLEAAERATTVPLITRSCVNTDALSFLKRLPNKSVSIFASQLESVMVQKYREAVDEEIQRVLHPDGALIQYDSEFKLDTSMFEQSEIKSGEEKLTWELQKFKPKSKHV